MDIFVTYASVLLSVRNALHIWQILILATTKEENSHNGSALYVFHPNIFLGGEILDYQLFKHSSFRTLLIKGSGGAVWFIYVLFFVELIYWAIDKICKAWLIPVVCLIAAVVGYIADTNGVHLPYKLEVIGMGLMFYNIGVATKNMKALQQKLPIWLLLLLLIVDIGLAYIQNPRLDMADNCYGMGIPTILLALLGIYLTIQVSLRMDRSIPQWLRKPVVYIGRNTIVIVGLSQVILMSLKKFFDIHGVPNIIGAPIRHLLLWIALFAATWILNRYVPFLIGKTKK